MRVGQPGNARHHFVHAGVVLHGAGAQRIHAEIDGVVPGAQASVVANDLEFADFGHGAEIVAIALAQQASGADLGNVQWRKLVGGFAGGRLLEDESFVLAGMRADLVDFGLAHPLTASTAESICARVVVSVQHQSAALPNSG